MLWGQGHTEIITTESRTAQGSVRLSEEDSVVDARLESAVLGGEKPSSLFLSLLLQTGWLRSQRRTMEIKGQTVGEQGSPGEPVSAGRSFLFFCTLPPHSDFLLPGGCDAHTLPKVCIYKRLWGYFSFRWKPLEKPKKNQHAWRKPAECLFLFISSLFTQTSWQDGQRDGGMKKWYSVSSCVSITVHFITV